MQVKYGGVKITLGLLVEIQQMELMLVILLLLAQK